MPPNVRSGPAGSPLQPSRLTEAESLARTIADTIVSDGTDVGTLLALSDERDMWERVCLRREQEAYWRGHADGTEEGRRLESAEREAAWQAATSPVIRGLPRPELERRRWGDGGRERFAEPRPGDFPGRDHVRHQVGRGAA